MPMRRAGTLRLIAVLLGGLACLPSYGCGHERSAPPRIVAPSRPQALHAEPTPPSLDDALEALDHGLSGRDFRAMQLLDEEDAVASTYAVARWVQQAWLQPNDSTLRTGARIRRFRRCSAYV